MMKKNMGIGRNPALKRLFVFALAIVLLVGILPSGALAEELPAQQAIPAEEGTFTVAFLDHLGDPVGVTQEVELNGAATAPEAAPIPEGKTFAGWDSEEYLNVTRDLTIHALYDDIICTVAFADSGGAALSSVGVVYGASLSAEDIPAVENLKAWKDTVGNEYTPGQLAELAITADLALTAVIAEPEPTESLEPAEPSESPVQPEQPDVKPLIHIVTFTVGDAVSEPIEVADGEVIPAEAIPAADVSEGAGEGAVFLGWFEGEAAFDVTAPVTGEEARAISLAAKFGLPEAALAPMMETQELDPAAEFYTVYYDLAGGAGTLPVDYRAYQAGDEVAALSTDATNGTQVFAGWTIKGGDPTQIYQPGTKATIVDSDITFVATYKDKGSAVFWIEYSADIPGVGTVTKRWYTDKNDWIPSAPADFFIEYGVLVGQWEARSGPHRDPVTPGDPIYANNMGMKASGKNLVFVHSVTFEAGAGGGFSESAQGKVMYFPIEDGDAWGDAIAMVPTPVPNEGFYFSHWEEVKTPASTNLGKTPAWATLYPTITKTYLFKAVFTDTPTVTITFNVSPLAGGWLYDSYNYSAPTTVKEIELTVPAGTTWEQAIMTKQGIPGTLAVTGYRLIGWDPDPTEMVAADVIDESLVFTAHFAKDLTITTPSKSKTYDGTALTCTNAGSVTSSGLLPGDRLVVTQSGSVTHVSDSPVTNKLVSWDVLRGPEGSEVSVKSEYYLALITEGKLSITARAVNVVGDSNSFPFTGSLQKIDTFHIDTATPLVLGDTLSGATAYGSGTFPSAYPVVVDLANAQVVSTVAKLGDYALTPVEGLLTITDGGHRIAWSIEGDPVEKDYTGTEQSNDDFDVNLPSDDYEYENVTVTPAKGTNVAASQGSTTQTTYYQTVTTTGWKIWFDDDGDGTAELDVSQWFKEPTVTPGSLKIKPVSLLARTYGLYVKYGDPVPVLVKGDNIFMDYGDVTTVPMTKFFVNNENENVLDFTNAVFATDYRKDMKAGDVYTTTVSGIVPHYGNYTMEYMSSISEVAPFGLARLHVIGDSGSPAYSGLEQQINTYTVTGFGNSTEFTPAGQGAQPRDYEMEMPNGDRIIPNLPHISALGAGVNVDQYPVVVTAPSGLVLAVTPASNEFLDIWNAMKIVDVNGNDVKSNYYDALSEITTEDGLLAITPVALNVSVGNMTLTAGSSIPAQSDYQVAHSGFQGNDTPASLGGALVIDNAYTPQATAGQTFALTPSGYISTNYNITYTPGSLMVTAPGVSAYWVLFVDYEGSTLLDYRWYLEGEDAVPPADPTRAGYTFAGWDIPFTNVRSNLTVTAQYVPVVAPPLPEEAPPPEEVIPPPEVPEAAVEPVPTPAPVVIEQPPVPEAATPTWALWNLILTILTGVIMAVLLVGYFVGKKRKEDPQNRAGEQEDRQTLKRKGLLRVLSIIPAVVAVIVFILTEDMRLPMVMTDQWTVWMAVIAAVQAVIAVFTFKKWEKKEDNYVSDAGGVG